jgi:hypothetical protein
MGNEASSPPPPPLGLSCPGTGAAAGAACALLASMLRSTAATGSVSLPVAAR